MRFMTEYPVTSGADGGAWTDPRNVAEFARVAEESGVDGLAFTDHPAPSRKWLDGGGHETFDPFAALCYVAAVTRRLRLMTYLTVLAYRNPFLTARSMTTVDILSGGRATFVVGAGYLRSEFAALGVDFEERNALVDEAADVLRLAWSGDEVHFEGRHFRAFGVALRPGPVQKPHPPLWLGGNAGVVRERVAAWGQGWAPLMGDPALIRTTRTRPITTEQELAGMIRAIGDRMEELGRDRQTLDVAARSPTSPPPGTGADGQIDTIARLAGMGVTWTPFGVPQSSFGEALDGLRRFGEEVIAKLR